LVSASNIPFVVASEGGGVRGSRRGTEGGGGGPREATSPPAEDLGRGDSLASRRGNGSETVLPRPDGTEASGGFFEKVAAQVGG
jgi:hypothetical protein